MRQATSRLWNSKGALYLRRMKFKRTGIAGIQRFLRRRRWRKRKRWDSYCNRCGICCYEKKWDHRGRMYIDFNTPCPFLDKEKNICTVFPRRFSLCADCSRVTLFHALFASYLPPSCGYVKRFRKLRLFSKPSLFRQKQSSNL